VKLARVNTALLILIILVNGYTILLPVLPGMVYWWQNRDGKQSVRLEQKIRTLSNTRSKENTPADNRLIIPSMALDQPILEGKTARTLNQGLWRRPTTSTPDKGSNTVLAGHRLTYTNPQGTLYHLDKVRKGDALALWWKGKLYRYKVTETKTVGAHEISIEAPTDKPTLTIYTCTPLWLPKDRLVVIAQLEDS
jgi:LPXTG-site transpeptidase (sortase) family protein